MAKSLKFAFSPDALVLDEAIIPICKTDWKGRRATLAKIPEGNSLVLQHLTDAGAARTTVSRELFELLLLLARKARDGDPPAVLEWMELPQHRKGTRAQNAYTALRREFPADDGPVLVCSPMKAPKIEFEYEHPIDIPDKDADVWLKRSGICNAVLRELGDRTGITRISMIAAEGAVAAAVVSEVLPIYSNLEMRLLVSTSNDPHYANAKRVAHEHREHIVNAATASSPNDHGLSIVVIEHDVLPVVHGIGLHGADGRLEIAEVGIAGYDEDGNLTCWATETPFETGRLGSLAYERFHNHLRKMEDCGQAKQVWP